MQVLRVLHVTPYSADAWAYGGIPRISDVMTRELAARGHAVTLCATDVCDSRRRLAGNHASTGRPTGSQADAGVALRIFPNVSNQLAYRYQCFLPLGMDGWLRRHARTFDVAHLHACRNLPGAIAARHLYAAGVPYVLAPNGTAPVIERRTAAKHAFDALLGRQMLTRASRVLAVTDAERAQLRTLGVPGARIRVVPNPVDLQEFEAAHGAGAWRTRRNGPLVAYLGQITPRKRTDLLVRAFAGLGDKSATLVIAGNDAGGAHAARAAAAQAGIADQVLLPGLLQGRARLDLLADADVVVYPSEHEIFGLVPLEALLCGTPVIVADDSGCGEVVRSVGGGLVVPGTVDAVRGALATIVCDREHWRAAARQAALRVRARFAPDVVCAQIEHVYREMAAA